LIVPRPTICLVTGDRGTDTPILDLIGEAVDAGVDLIQIRERRISARTLLGITSRAVALARGTGSRILVNDRADVAIAAGAAGVHLRGDSFDATRLRPVAPAGFLIGRSVHNRDEAAAAQAEGCDYVLFGTVFSSSSKPEDHEVAGVAALRDLAGSVQLPVLAIGGISLANVTQVAQAGASGIAAISLFENEASLAATVAELRRRFDT
jgi:thiamine-phosphate diphosphorylase